MKIYGIGTDIADINRLNKSLKRKNFIKKIFNDDEIKKCNNQLNKVSCYAKRFAAKEAFSKAIGTGIAKGLKFNEIIVYNTKLGKPSIKLQGKTKKIVIKILKKKTFNIFLSLSDEKIFAIATVIISL